MLISITIVAVLCVIVLIALFRPERRKRYNEFHGPVSTASGTMIYGDTGGAGGICDGGCGGGGGDGGC
jgi:uncharacterized membrane protein YfcA